MPLCRECHKHAPWKQEITPNQFKWLTENVELINANIERLNFWECYTSAIEKGRVIVAGITEIEFDVTSSDIRCQLEYFKELDSYNDFCGMFMRSSSEPPHIDEGFEINRSLWSASRSES